MSMLQYMLLFLVLVVNSDRVQTFTELYTLAITACSYMLLVIFVVCMWSSAAMLKRVSSQEFRTQTQ